MISTIIVLVVLASGLVTSIIFPVHLPEEMISAIEVFLGSLLPFNGVFPIFTFLQALTLIIFIRVMYLIFKIVVGIISWVTGSGQPEIE